MRELIYQFRASRAFFLLRRSNPICKGIRGKDYFPTLRSGQALLALLAMTTYKLRHHLYSFSLYRSGCFEYICGLCALARIDTHTRMAHYFISDVHLGYGDRPGDLLRERRLLRFLDGIRADAQSLFIVGDLFDYWFEYRSVIPKRHFRTLAAITAFAERGCAVHYIIGNHDFGHRDFFQTEVGAVMHEGDYETTLDGKKFYIAHGDGKAANDLGYRILKKILRSKINLKLFSLLHPDLGIAIAARASHGSRAYTAQKDYGPTDGMTEFAKRKLAEGFDYVVMGHRHKPLQVPANGGLYVNLGDWIRHFSYAVCEQGVLSLRTYEEQLHIEPNH